MKEIAVMVFFLFSFCVPVCAQAIDSETYYVPITIEVAIADGASIPEEVLPAVKENIKIYTADLSGWDKRAKPVNVLVKITEIHEANIASSFVFGALSPSILMGEMTILDGDKKKVMTVKGSCRSTPWTAFFGKKGMNQRLAVYFADQVVGTIQQPFTEQTINNQQKD